MSEQRKRKLEKEGCKHLKSTDEIGTPEQIAKAVHQKLDWVRACNERSDDHRGFDVEALLVQIQRGYELTKSFPKHYEEDPR